MKGIKWKLDDRRKSSAVFGISAFASTLLQMQMRSWRRILAMRSLSVRRPLYHDVSTTPTPWRQEKWIHLLIDRYTANRMNNERTTAGVHKEQHLARIAGCTHLGVLTITLHDSGGLTVLYCSCKCQMPVHACRAMYGPAAQSIANYRRAVAVRAACVRACVHIGSGQDG